MASLTLFMIWLNDIGWMEERFSRSKSRYILPVLPPLAILLAREMAARLRAGHDTIASIALDVGYESEAAFSRAFKRLCGAAPSAWRRTDASMPPTPDAPPAGRIPR